MFDGYQSCRDAGKAWKSGIKAELPFSKRSRAQIFDFAESLRGILRTSRGIVID
jgi:hypothetical protein